MKPSLVLVLWKLAHLADTSEDFHSEFDDYEDYEDLECPNGWTLNPENNHCYFISEQYAKFEIADETCRTLSSSLASVLTFDEHLFLLPLIFAQRRFCTSFDNCLNYWIGLRNANSVCINFDTWTWIDKSPVSDRMMFWGINFPTGRHRCVSLQILPDPIDMQGYWGDESCDFPLRYICKRESSDAVTDYKDAYNKI